MRDIDIFQLALGLTPPWIVTKSELNLEKNQLDIYIDFQKGGTFVCPVCGKSGCKAYDTEEKTWRHLDFFQYKAYLHARVPRINCPDCGVKTVNVPWARPGSGFTLLFEAYIMTLAKEMPVKAIARMVNEHDTRLWRILSYYVSRARQKEDYSNVTKIGVDETSFKRGHDYVTIFADLEHSKILFVAPGKDYETLEKFRNELVLHNGNPEKIKEICIDMSPAFIKGARLFFPKANLTFDKFHVMKIINEAVDRVRRAEQKERPELKGTKYLWLKNIKNLTKNQKEKLLSLKNRNIKTAKAYNIKLSFQELWQLSRVEAEQFLKKWYFWATHSRLEPIIEAAKIIKNHWNGVLNWFSSNLNNGILEGLNSVIQAAKRKARGYRSLKNFATMIYLVGGKLNLEF
ncbi:ISL3 family transposase [Carboxydothermus ferrireducens]|nr:ISL3 family transposase [Carboxydothermus ferrireducens]